MSEKYTPQELARMTGEAMIAWSKDQDVRLESWNGSEWLEHAPSPITNFRWLDWARPRRIKPAKRKVPLDHSDFVGPNRVTHIKVSDVVWSVASIGCAGVGTAHGYVPSFENLREQWKVSRDNGLTWGPAEKEVEA